MATIKGNNSRLFAAIGPIMAVGCNPGSHGRPDLYSFSLPGKKQDSVLTVTLTEVELKDLVERWTAAWKAGKKYG